MRSTDEIRAVVMCDSLPIFGDCVLPGGVVTDADDGVAQIGGVACPDGLVVAERTPAAGRVVGRVECRDVGDRDNGCAEVG
ncbi:hypothetical protein A4G28_04135 [Mycobacterium ostraviense]|uniref:Uncharacterized protein n=1 Tax=Mycobacterium ostraviense TaxID=2738409 RepID=A0A164DR21_9MYCO|nr:hypothetical protein A4G28_04135 [Mycobacterium ostraviense]